MKTTKSLEDAFGFAKYHQKFQVPKMEVLNLIRLFWGHKPYLTCSLYR